VDLKLELVVVPVSDLDRAKAFYAEKLGFTVDHDQGHRRVSRHPADPSRVGWSSQTYAAHAHLVERGVEVSEAQVFDGGSFRPSRAGDALDYAGFIFFRDPDGNSWAVQQMPARDENDRRAAGVVSPAAAIHSKGSAIRSWWDWKTSGRSSTESSRARASPSPIR
jgi:catechol 2,3-dioxygenase-like lactoylglutathione lyase family enzyme